MNATPRLLSRLLLAIALGTAAVVPAGEAAPTPPAAGQEVRLDEFFDGEVDWALNLGTEFPGAQGTVSAAPGPKAGQTAVRLAGDFSKGGAYIDTGRWLHGAGGVAKRRRLMAAAFSPLLPAALRRQAPGGH